jgi:hypothetical protein
MLTTIANIIALLIAAYGFTLPPSKTVSTSSAVPPSKRRQRKISAYLTDFKQWTTWSFWEEKDATVKRVWPS